VKISFTYLENESFSSYVSILTGSQNPSSFNLFFKVTLCLNKTNFENIAHRLSGSLLRIYVIILEPVLRPLFLKPMLLNTKEF
jgi:hypothetical protein